MGVRQIPRYISLCIKIAKYSYIASLEYRFQYVVRVLRILIEFGLAFIFIDIFFQNTQELGSWSKYEVILLYGVFTCIFSLVFLLINGNLEELAWKKIDTGELDGILAKPIDSQFLISFEKMHVQNFWRVGFGIAMAIFALTRLNLAIDVVQILAFLVTVLSALIIQYSMLFIVATTALWTITSEPVDMVETTLSITRYPMDIFPAKVVKWLTIIPIIFIATVPTKALLGRYDLLTWLSPFVATIMLFLSRKFWHFALRHYSSASS